MRSNCQLAGHTWDGGKKIYAGLRRDTEPRRPAVRIAHDFVSPCRLKALRPHIRAGSLRAAAEIPLVCNRRAAKPEHGLS